MSAKVLLLPFRNIPFSRSVQVLGEIMPAVSFRRMVLFDAGAIMVVVRVKVRTVRCKLRFLDLIP